jgi:multicomponent Na+:H+ antiporter subunit D
VTTVLVPLLVAVPLLAAAALAAVGHFAPPRIANLVAIAVATAVAAMSVVLIFRTADHTIHYWFGGWHPRDGIAIGISFSVDPVGAALAALIAVLAAAALVQTLEYFEDAVPPYFHVLMLIFLGAMVGFALSSDLFNLFVFFELMSTAAFALTGYRVERPSVLQGAINFAVVSAIGSFFLLFGIGLVYGRTGALNLAQIGQVLSRQDADGLVVIAFVFLLVGLLTKAGAVPFHFWLSDAYAVAPAPVCILFAGVMSDLALHAVARIYWNGFSEALDGGSLRAILVGFGVATALVGAALAFAQSSLKRMMAFVTISHIGVFLCGIGLLTARGLAATTVYVIADGLVKGAIFCAIADLGSRLGHTDELILHGRGRALPLTGAVLTLGALGLAVLPPVGTFVAFDLLRDASSLAGYGWLPLVLVVATGITGGAVLRSAGRIFLGLGPSTDDALETPRRGEEEEAAPAAPRRPHRGVLLWGPAAALLLVGLGLAVVPGLAAHAVQHAERFVDRAAAARETLHGAAAPLPPLPSVGIGAAGLAYGVASVAVAFAAAWLGLYRQRLPASLRRAVTVPTRRPLRRLLFLHDGVVGDYVAWAIAGAAALAALVAALAR